VQHANIELLFVDETTLSLNYPIRSAGMKRGQQKTIPAFAGKRIYLHVIGAYNYRTDCVTSIQVEWKNSPSFIEFLEHLLVHTYPMQHNHIYIDDASLVVIDRAF
jgi:hypothetical protein